MIKAGANDGVPQATFLINGRVPPAISTGLSGIPSGRCFGFDCGFFGFGFGCGCGRGFGFGLGLGLGCGRACLEPFLWLLGRVSVDPVELLVSDRDRVLEVPDPLPVFPRGRCTPSTGTTPHPYLPAVGG